ncbi:MAG TPA: sigma-70 family RNA polymerase sigma factor [Blastocatellia bacterium]|nr:sigma-70 family RNA polymerase sigma factor [Blastocatellia bacterium]
MTTVESLVHRARGGDVDAYEALVLRFQDMAVGYGYSILRDFQSAEDAAQEAFFEAYRNLDNLREPAAFPGWFRRIVFKQCDRLTRRGSAVLVPLDSAEDPACGKPTQADVVEQREMQDQIMAAVDSLPDHERATTMLYYISGYSQNEVAAFLDVPVTTVKKRLHSARKRLREMLVDLVEDSLRERRPSRDESFATRVIEILKAARSGDAATVKRLIERDQRLIAARDPMGNTAMIMAVNFGQTEVAELLLAAGVRPDIHEAAAIGDTDRVRDLLDDEPALLDSYSPEGFTPLELAAHFGQIEVARFLIAAGANVNDASRHAMKLSPLHAALFGKRTEIARMLLDHGADINARRGGAGMPRAGWTALHYCAGFGFTELARYLVERGADTKAVDDEGRTPLDVANEASHQEIVALLSDAEH